MRLPRRTVRLRLTALYSGLFLVSGIAMLAVIYLLLNEKLLLTKTLMQATPPDGNGGVGAGVAGSIYVITNGSAGGRPPSVWRLLALAGIVLAVMFLISIAVGWWTAGRVLRPLRTITGATRRITSENLHRRLGMTGPDDELKDLADTIDELLVRLEGAFDAQKEALEHQRRFVANASHELRRPLTLERAALEIALADPAANAQSLRATCERVLATSKQQERLIDALLTLARGQRGLDRYDPVDVAAVTDEVLLARRDEVLRRDLRLSTDLAPTAALGDARLVERLVVNLVDNAILHNVPGGELVVATWTERGRSVLAVANGGTVIPPDEVDRLLRPFQRLGADRTHAGDGHGLGLSIVAAIAAAHHAELQVSARPAGGLEVRIHFPSAATSSARPASRPLAGSAALP